MIDIIIWSEQDMCKEQGARSKEQEQEQKHEQEQKQEQEHVLT